jgi:hypothetical protein
MARGQPPRRQWRSGEPARQSGNEVEGTGYFLL